MTNRPNLEDAYAVWERGGEHLTELKVLYKDVIRAQGQAILARHNAKSGIKPKGEWFKLFEVDQSVAIPTRCQVIIGDIANNFRSALDYLVKQLADLDSGVDPKRKPQFPIESKSQVFQ
jgi:hypothetical protein